MRQRFFLAPLVLAGLAVGSAGVAGVAGAETAEPASPATTVPGFPTPDLASIMEVLTPEQLTCIVQSMGSVDPAADPMAAMTALTDCGVSMDQLMQIAAGQPVAPTGATVPPTSAGATAGTPDAATVSAVLALVGLDSTELGCLASALSVPPTDDAGALSVLQGCQISLVELLSGLVAAGDGTAAPPAVTLPGVGVPTTAALSTGDPMADLFIQQFAAMGMTLTPEQAACLGQQVSSGAVDPATIEQDFAAITGLLTTCGIDIADLMGG